MKISSRLFMRKQRFHSLISVCSRTEREEFQWKNIFFLKTLSKSWKKYMIQLNSLQWCSFLWKGHLEENPSSISIFSPFPHMKSHSFLSTFIRYAFTALVTLYIVYWWADFHINDLPWFTLQEWFMIAGEALVFCAFILAFKDTRKSAFEEFMDWINFNMIPIVPWFNAEEVANSVETLRKYWNKEKKTTKGIPLSEEHKKKISESLKRKNAEKKAQQERIQKTATASQKRKAAKK